MAFGWCCNSFLLSSLIRQLHVNRISGVRVSVFASGAVDRGSEPQSDQTKDYKIGICCFSAKHAALGSKSKDWLARNQNNVSKWSDMSIRGLLFQWASTIKIQACWSRTKRTSSSSHWKWTCPSHDITETLMSWRETATTHSLNYM